MMKKFFQAILDAHYVGRLNSGNRRDRRKAKRIMSKQAAGKKA